MEIPSHWKYYPALMALIDDHHFVALLTSKIRQALKKNIDLGAISAYILFYYEKDLLQLFKRQQDILDRVLPAKDHCRINIKIQQEIILTLINKMQINPRQLSLIEKLIACLESYSHFEKTILFDYLESQGNKRFRSLKSPSIKKEHSGFENWNDRFCKFSSNALVQDKGIIT